MAQEKCPYCRASSEGMRSRSLVAGGGRFLTECRCCERIVEERCMEVGELFIERAHDAPLSIVTPDFHKSMFHMADVSPMEDDPFESSGFITAFSTWSLEMSPLFTATSMSFGGHLAELERVLSDSVSSSSSSSSSSGCEEGGAAPKRGKGGHESLVGTNVSTVDNLKAYFVILEAASVLGLERDICDHALQLFRECASTTYLRNRNIDALATAALVQAMRAAQEPRSLQEVSVAAQVPQKEIGRHIKVLSDALKLSQPYHTNSVSIHMPRFCALLQLCKSTQDLATHVADVVIHKSFCTRRNPISISAAAIYLACQVEDKRKTQSEICKATGLTEVTLRKVYKEMVEHLDELLPPGYAAAVSMDRLNPVSGGAHSHQGYQSSKTGQAAAAGGDPTLPPSPYSSILKSSSNHNPRLAVRDGNYNGVAPASSAAVASGAGVGGGAGGGAGGGPYWGGSLPSNTDGRWPPWPPIDVPDHLAQVSRPEAERERESQKQQIGLFSNGPMMGGVDKDHHHQHTNYREKDNEKDKEQDRTKDTGSNSGPTMKTINDMMAAIPSSCIPGLKPSYFPFPQQFDPRIWPFPVYNAAAVAAIAAGGAAAGPTTTMGPEEGGEGRGGINGSSSSSSRARGDDNERSKSTPAAAPTPTPAPAPAMVNPQQSITFLPGMLDGSVSMSSNGPVQMVPILPRGLPSDAAAVDRPAVVTMTTLDGKGDPDGQASPPESRNDARKEKMGVEESGGHHPNSSSLRAVAAGVVPVLHPPPQQTNAAAAAVSSSSGRQVAAAAPAAPMFTGYPPGFWPFIGAQVPPGSVPYGMYPQLVPAAAAVAQTGSLPHFLHQGRQDNVAVAASTSADRDSEYSKERLPPASRGSTEENLLTRVGGGPQAQAQGMAIAAAGQSNHLALPWPGAPFHPFYFPPTVTTVDPTPCGNTGAGIRDRSGSHHIDDNR